MSMTVLLKLWLSYNTEQEWNSEKVNLKAAMPGSIEFSQLSVLSLVIFKPIDALFVMLVWY